MFVRRLVVCAATTAFKRLCANIRSSGCRSSAVLLGLFPLLTLSCTTSRSGHAPLASAAGGTSVASVPSSAPEQTAGSVPPPSADEIAAAEGRVRAQETDPAARIALAGLYRRAGKIPQAAHELQTAVRLAPKDAEAYRQLAAIYRLAAYLDRETDALTTALHLDPGDWQSALRLASIYLDLGWYDRAKQALTQAARTAPQEPRVLVREASYDSMRQMYPAMQKAAEEGLRLAPNDATFTVILAEANRLQGNYSAAEQGLRQAIAHTTDPTEQAQNYCRLAFLLLNDSRRPLRLAEAEQAARSGLAQDPNSVEAHYRLAQALDLQHKPAEAEEEYARAARQDVQFESTALQLGRFYLRSPDPARRAQGQKLMAMYQAAEQNGRDYARARAALSADLGSADLHRKMAVWYLKTHRLPEAIVELRQTLAMRPADREARRLLAQALKSAGRITEAKAYAR